MALSDELAALDEKTHERLTTRGFRRERLLEWAATMGSGKDERNRLKGRVVAPAPSDIVDAPQPGTEGYDHFRERGLELLREGRVALCVLAGGMATRMGGVVKALVEAVPGHTFLDLRLAEQRAMEALAGRKVPLWLMTSEATRGPIEQALGARHDGVDVAVFEQCVAPRLTPEGSVFREDDGGCSVYATGHGDLPEALRESGLLRRFLADRGSGYVWMTNLDNLGATVDPAMLGWMVDNDAQLMVEVVDKVGTDRGGVPVLWDGRRIIAEEFRLPADVDANAIRVFNTNTFLCDASRLENLSFDFTFVEVEKQVQGRKAVQFERLLGEITVAIEPVFMRVPRDGVASRFLPVKDTDELARRRPEIEAIGRARGMLP
jgi:UTP--glucose-1-phosphate uridylyltransferase